MIQPGIPKISVSVFIRSVCTVILKKKHIQLKVRQFVIKISITKQCSYMFSFLKEPSKVMLTKISALGKL